MATFNGDVIKYSVTGAIPLNTNVGGVIDLLNWPTGVSVQVASMGASCVLTPEISNDDGATGVWVAVNAISATAPTSPQAVITAAGIYLLPQNARFLRLRVSTAATSGTTTLAITDAGENPTFAAVQGNGAAATTAAGNPVRVAVVGRTANVAVLTGQTTEIAATLNGAPVVKQFSIPDLDWYYAGPLAGLNTAVDTAAKAAGAAAIRNYVTAIQLQNNGATATEFQIKDGAATVMWRCMLPANSGMQEFEFPTPLRGTGATALNVQAVTAGAVVICNLQGYQAN